VLGPQSAKNLRDLSALVEANIPISYALGVLGMPARTAYSGLLEAKVKQGDTIVVSGAAGAVGSIVVQLAKIYGCFVVAITSSDEKMRWLKELGADQTISYKENGSVEQMNRALKEAAPNGIDIYWDNVGGFVTDSIWDLMNIQGRVIICGQITQYNGGLDSPTECPRFLHHVLYKRLTIRGILARDYNHQMDLIVSEMLKFLQTGKLTYRETIIEGFDQLPLALNKLFSSENIGKMIVKI
jgi:NADPH-dependent curcumin reductase CurA